MMVLDGSHPEYPLHMYGRFAITLRVCRPDTAGPVKIYRVGAEEVAEEITFDMAAGHLKRFCSRYAITKYPEYNPSTKDCRSIVEAWTMTRTHFQEIPPAVALKHTPGVCLSRLAIEPCWGDEPVLQEILRHRAPFFAEIMSRMTNADAFCARVGSIFDYNAPRKQVIWCHGLTDSGKSDLLWLIKELSGKAAAHMNNASFKTPFWKGSIVGKRTVLVSESATQFIRSDDFKSITGDDWHSINQKNIKEYTARLQPLFFFFSNNPPEVERDDAFLRRIIPCEIQPIPKDSILQRTQVEAALRAEMPTILGYCLARWDLLKAMSEIPCEREQLVQAAENYQAIYLDFVDANLIVDEKAQIDIQELTRLMLTWGFHTRPAQVKCKQVILQHTGAVESRITVKTVSGEEKRVRVFRGIREREKNERQYTV